MIIRLLVFTSLVIFGQANEEPPTRQGISRAGPTPNEAMDSEVRVYRVENGDASYVANTVTKLTGLQAISDMRTNSMIVSTNAAGHARVADIISKLDILSNVEQQSDVRIIEIANREVEDLARRTSEVFRRDLTVSADEWGRRILLRGDRQIVELATQLIDSLDKPLPTATIEFAFFQVTDSSDKPEIIGVMPNDLKDVSNELLRFGNVKLNGRMMTAAVESREFRINGAISEQTQFNVLGQLGSAAENGVVKMSVEAKLERTDLVEIENSPQRTRMRSSLFSIQTTLIAPRGEYVVLGSAPHGTEAGQSVILVVHVPKSK